MSARDFDVVVIGAGPAGLEAASTVAAAGFSVVSIDRMGPGGQLMNLGVLRDMPDRDPEAMGPDLVAELAERAMSAGAELAIDDVSAVRFEDGFAVEALDGAYKAPVLVVATGLTAGTTGLADEARFEGAGLSHCAHCDAPLYVGQPVVVAGSDAWAVEEALELAGHASSVALVVADASGPGGDRAAALRSLPNVSVVVGAITELIGAAALEGVGVTGASGAAQHIAARGLFLQTGRTPALGIIQLDGAGADRMFLAGDVRPGAARTIASAIADGAEAGQNAVAWLRAGAGR
jgi:thioredoxin reductase